MERMMEKAKEELELLQTNYPNRFDYLKIELKSFISLLQSQLLLDPLPSTSSATTQASTTMKRKEYLKRRNKDKGRWESDEIDYKKKKKKVKMQRDIVDVVLEKAEACLQTIEWGQQCCIECCGQVFRGPCGCVVGLCCGWVIRVESHQHRFLG